MRRRRNIKPKPWRPKPVGLKARAPTGDLNHEAKVAYAHRARALRAIGFESYGAYLASELWRAIREYTLRRKPSCSFCKAKAWQVHHHSYSVEVLLGNRLSDLYPVCDECHRHGEFLPDGSKAAPRQATARMRERCLAAARGSTKGSPP